MDEARIAEIKARWEKATKGPWTTDEQEYGSGRPCTDACYIWQKDKIKDGYLVAEVRGWGYLTGGASPGKRTIEEAQKKQNANRDFIAASWTDIRDLLAEVERLKGENNRLLHDKYQLQTYGLEHGANDVWECLIDEIRTSSKYYQIIKHIVKQRQRLRAENARLKAWLRSASRIIRFLDARGSFAKWLAEADALEKGGGE